MAIYLVTLLTLLNYTSMKGSKVLISLFALELGTSQLLLGVIYAMYSVFPIVLAVYAGKLSDRLGMRIPMLLGSCGLAGGLLIPWLLPNLIGLIASAILIGMLYIFFAVSVQTVVGFMPGDRARNYSILSLGNAGSSFLGPLCVGFSIDANGHALTYLYIGLVPFVCVLLLLLGANVLPNGRRSSGKKDPTVSGTVAMLKECPDLRRILLASVAIEAALELYAFYMPIYGHSIGLSASQIGIVMATYATAMVAIRLISSVFVNRFGGEAVLASAMLVAAALYCVFPFADTMVHLAVIAFVLGLSLGCCVPLATMLIHERAPTGRAGEANGVRQTLNKATDLCTPVVFAALGTAIGTIAIFWMFAALLFAGSTKVIAWHVRLGSPVASWRRSLRGAGKPQTPAR